MGSGRNLYGVFLMTFYVVEHDETFLGRAF